MAGLLEAAIAVPCICTVAGFFGRAWWPLELTCHFRPQYFVFLACAAAVLVIRRKRRAGMVVALFACVNLFELLPLYVGVAPPPGPGATHRAFLLNVRRANREHDRVLACIRTADPDLIVLEEVDARWMPVLAALRQDYPASIFRTRRDDFGIALLSRLPLADARIEDIGPPGRPSVVARVAVAGREVTVIGTHPLPPVNRRFARMRNQQLRDLARVAKACNGPVMILGDMNATSWSPHFRDLLRAGGLRDSRQGFGVQPTWPAGRPWLWAPIDHCLVSSDIVVHRRAVGPSVGSDHHPVVVDFSLRERGATP